MNKADLGIVLSQKKSLNETLDLAFKVADGRIAIQDLLDLCIHKKQQIAFRAAWVLENVEGFSLECFKPNVFYFIDVY